MNEKRAKELRKRVFGDFSTRGTKYTINAAGIIFCAGRRRLYQMEKRAIKHPPSDVGKLKGKLHFPKWLVPKKVPA